MNKGIMSKGILIFAIVSFAVLLILPTVDSKEFRITFAPDANDQQRRDIDTRFSTGFVIEKKGDLVVIKGFGINDAVMNEVRAMPGVRDALIMPHWAERGLLAKKVNLGLDLQGGMSLVLKADYETMEKKLEKTLSDSERTEITQQALELLRNRVDKFGVAEPSIRPRGNDAIELQLPGVKDPNAVKKAIGTTGRVEYRLVDDEGTRRAGEWLKQNAQKMNIKNKDIAEDNRAQAELLADITKGTKLSDKLELVFYFERDAKSKKIFPSYPMALEKHVALAGDDMSKAWVGNDEYGGLTVHFTTTPDGAAKFAAVTSEKNKGRRLAIVIDDKVRSAPSIRETIPTGSAQITGDFTLEEVNTLARIIKEGALPVNLTIIEERSVGPSLGQDAIDAGFKATMLAFVVVSLFMFVYYKASGVIAVLGIALNFLLTFAMLSWLGFTLTLPGIAGLILTIGMTVDGNVLIYERMKEELRGGKSVRAAVVNGFDRAFWAIFDSNVTTLIAAFVLAQFGTGPVRGFAVSLSIGLLASMFVVLYITRYIFEVISTREFIKKLSI
ncbi:MAG: protein translocase subunit SecD [Spirochaetes bacterium]|nr:MAG: protein translocase subunit SecD [Spirochaetota bacterium]